MVKVEAYNGINSYLSEISETRIKTIEDVMQYNQENSGTEGANPGEHPAFPTGQVSHGIILTFTFHKTHVFKCLEQSTWS